MLNILVENNQSSRIFGIKILLRQLGVPFLEEAQEDEADILVTSDIKSRSRARVRVVLLDERDYEPALEIGPRFVQLGNTRAFAPFHTYLPPAWKSMTPIAQFDSGEPAIARHGEDVLIIADFCRYITYSSTLRVYDETFAHTFSWDAFRQILLGLLEILALSLGKPLFRLWNYPSWRYRNSLTYTVDVDHLLAWRIVQDLTRRAALRASLDSLLPKFVVDALAVAASHGDFGLGLYTTEYMSCFHAILGRFLKSTGLSLPSSCYLASLNHIHAAGIPITAFVRPRSHQIEESIETYRFRKPYTAQPLPGIETALHFGATLKVAHKGQELVPLSGNPYVEDVFREGVLTQVDQFTSELGMSRFGTRLHHVFGFNQEMFHYLNKSDAVLYDSSIFGTVGNYTTRTSPIGCTLPFAPVLFSDRNLRGTREFARFLEIPATAYETDEIPFEAMRKPGGALVISEHPDRRRSPAVAVVLREFRRRREELWPVTLEELAIWWTRRGRVRLCDRTNKLHVRGVKRGEPFCLVQFPPAEPPAVAACRVLSSTSSEGRNYYDCEPESDVA